MTCTRRPYSTWTSCRCEPCRATTRRLNKLSHNGLYRRPSSAQATVRIIGWLEAGYSHTWIASACGVPARFVKGIEADFRTVGIRKIGPRRAGMILAADIDAATAGYAPADRTRDQLRALAVLGWGLQEVADETGLSLMTLSVIRSGKVATTGPRNMRAVRDAYRVLARRPGPSPAVAARARAQGWPSVIDIEDVAS